MSAAQSDRDLARRQALAERSVACLGAPRCLAAENQDDIGGIHCPACPVHKEMLRLGKTTTHLPRSRAAKLLDELRAMLAQRREPDEIEAWLARQYGIEPLKPCHGEAHSNAYIDNCMVCAPRWGWLGPKVEVR